MEADVRRVARGVVVIRASAIAHMDVADLLTGQTMGGSAATDDGPALSAAVQAATRANPVKLILDGAAQVSTLFLPTAGHITVEGMGWDTGLYVAGTANDGIRNGPIGAPNTPLDPGSAVRPPQRGDHLSYLDFFLNASQVGHAGAAYAFGISILDIENVVIRRVKVYEPAKYGIRFSNVGRVVIDEYQCVRANERDRPFNTDGIHFDGLCDNAIIRDCLIESGDDAIALNCPEGYGGSIGAVTVDACSFLGCYCLMRLYTTYGTARYTIDTVLISKCTGTFFGAIFLFGLFTPSTGFGAGQPVGLPRSIQSFQMTDSRVTGAPVFGAISTNMGYLCLSNIVWTLTQKVTFNAFPFYNGAVVETLRLDSFSIIDAGGVGPIDALFDFTGGGTIRHLILDSLDTTNLAACVKADQWAHLEKVSGTGVLATGWEFPDSVMADGTPYLSASSHLPSIRIRGQVKTMSTVACS